MRCVLAADPRVSPHPAARCGCREWTCSRRIPDTCAWKWSSLAFQSTCSPVHLIITRPLTVIFNPLSFFWCPRDDVNLVVGRSEVTICALKPQSSKEARGLHYMNERHFGRFFRRLQVPYLCVPTQ